MAFRIYTRTGDEGETSLFGGKRLPKDHLRIESYGTLDELNAQIGLLRDQLQDPELREELHEIQNRLFSMGSYLAMDPDKKSDPIEMIRKADVEALEQAMDRMDEDLEPLRNFILPGGHVTVSQAHIARCVCRRAERLVVALSREESVEGIILQYLNRLSDFFFILARYLGHRLGVEEVIWSSRS
jgi:cob(I)alamin adenosyltransferase